MGDIQKLIVKKFMRGDVLGPYIDECEAIRLHITALEALVANAGSEMKLVESNANEWVKAKDGQVEELQTELRAAEALQFKAYCAGYESGHNDTVESHYAPPVDYPEEWEEIVNDLRVEAQEDSDHG